MCAIHIGEALTNEYYKEGTHMSGIYKITAGQWDANGEMVEDDTDYYTHQESPVIDGKEVQVCDRIHIPVVGVGDKVPPPGTMAYLLGILGVPDGIYIITDNDDNSSGGVTDNAV